MKKKSIFYTNKIGFFLALLFFSLFFFSEKTKAITISPIRQTIAIDPGGKEEVEIEVVNDREESIKIFPEVDAFNIDEKTGAAIFGAYDPAKQWVKSVDGSTVLLPGERKIFKFEINIPAEAIPGGHYLGLFASESPSEGMVAIGTRSGSLLFLHVAGEVRESLVKDSFFSNKSIYFKLPIELFLKYKNDGTIYVSPEGGVVLRKESGKEIARKILNLDRRKVLPGEKWYEEYTFDDLNWKSAGKIQAVSYIQYGATKQQAVDSISFWYIPKSVIIFFVLFFTVIVFVFWLLKKKKRKKFSKLKIIK